jgi:hypothetical protein
MQSLRQRQYSPQLKQEHRTGSELCPRFGPYVQPMVVTLPFALILLDYWPLRRFSQRRSAQEIGTVASKPMPPNKRTRRSMKHGKGCSPLLLTERIEHVDEFAERLKGFAKNVIVLKGGTGKKERKVLAERIASIPDGEEVTTKLDKTV